MDVTARYEDQYFKNKQPQLMDFKDYDREVWHREVVDRAGDLDGNVILDVGCGAGKTMHLLRHANVVGVDISGFAIGIASKYGEVIRASATELPLRDGAFNSVLMVDLVEHLRDEELSRALAEAHRVLRRDGTIIVHTQPNGLFGKPFYFINRNRLEETGHVNSLSPWKLRFLLLHHNFTLLELTVKDFVALKHLEKRKPPKLVRWLLGNRIIGVGNKWR